LAIMAIVVSVISISVVSFNKEVVVDVDMFAAAGRYFIGESYACYSFSITGNSEFMGNPMPEYYAGGSTGALKFISTSGICVDEICFKKNDTDYSMSEYEFTTFINVCMIGDKPVKTNSYNDFSEREMESMYECYITELVHQEKCNTARIDVNVDMMIKNKQEAQMVKEIENDEVCKAHGFKINVTEFGYEYLNEKGEWVYYSTKVDEDDIVNEDVDYVALTVEPTVDDIMAQHEIEDEYLELAGVIGYVEAMAKFAVEGNVPSFIIALCEYATRILIEVDEDMDEDNNDKFAYDEQHDCYDHGQEYDPADAVPSINDMPSGYDYTKDMDCDLPWL